MTISYFIYYFIIVAVVAILANRSLPLFFVAGSLIPVSYLDVNSYIGVLYPSLVIGILLILKKIILQEMGSSIFALNLNVSQITLISFLMISLVWSGNFTRSLGFNISLMIMFVLIPLLSFTEDFLVKLRRSWITLANFAAVVGIIEWGMKKNVLFNSQFNQQRETFIQDFGVYRVQSFIGHPLMTGTFFSITTVFALIMWLNYGRQIYLISCLLNQLALVLTFSRGPIIAGLVGISVALIYNYRAIGTGKKPRFILVPFLCLYFGSAIYVLTTRDNFTSGVLSYNSRILINQVATRDVTASLLGNGGGTAQTLFSSQLNSNLILENSLLEILYGLGIIGLLLFLLNIGSFIKNRSFEKRLLVPMTTTFFLCALNFNMLEGCRSSHAYFALICLASRILKKPEKVK